MPHLPFNPQFSLHYSIAWLYHFQYSGFRVFTMYQSDYFRLTIRDSKVYIRRLFNVASCTQRSCRPFILNNGATSPLLLLIRPTLSLLLPFGHNVYNCTHQMNWKCIASKIPLLNSDMLSTIVHIKVYANR